MNIVFRVDASIEIGTGHVMRCLTLANALKEHHYQSYFICRRHKGHLFQLIENNGHKVFPLGEPCEAWTPLNTGNLLFHAKWLGVDMLEDADQTIDKLEKNLQKIDYLVVDHYALDNTWEDKLKPHVQKIMVIDDLVDRQHSCDLLLDQTFGRDKKCYQKLVPEKCIVLTGSHYALLRPEFVKWRKYSIKRRLKPKFQQLLITMGGVDSDNYTGKILQELHNCKFPDDLKIIVILGKTALHLKSVKKLATSLPFSINVKIGVDNIAEIMANADIAIGAAGATTWERCCLGLPSVQIVIAKNQESIAKSLSIRGVVSSLSDFSTLCEIFEKIKINYAKISLSSLAISDGKGVERVIQKLLVYKYNPNNIIFYPISKEDGEFLFSLQTHESRKYFRTTQMPSFLEHNSWFDKVMKSSDTLVFLILEEGIKLGVVRLDNLSIKKKNEISIIIDSQYSGKGIGKKVIFKILNVFSPISLLAVIHEKNIASTKVFKQHGFVFKSKSNSFITYTYET